MLCDAVAVPFEKSDTPPEKPPELKELWPILAPYPFVLVALLKMKSVSRISSSPSLDSKFAGIANDDVAIWLVFAGFGALVYSQKIVSTERDGPENPLIRHNPG